MEAKQNVICTIVNYNHDNNAIRLYEFFKNYYETYIIDTNYLDNGGTCPFDKNDSNILLEHNLLCGGFFIKSYELSKKINASYLLEIASDVEFDDENLKKIPQIIDKIIISGNIGGWEPSARPGSMCEGTTALITHNLHLFNQGTNNIREVKRGEGWCMLVKKEVCDMIMPHLDYKDNKYGWFVNESFGIASRKLGLKWVIDDRVVAYHPAGTGYSQQEAAIEREELKLKLKELGIFDQEPKQPDEIKTLLCCIGKNENKYIRDYVEWYKNLGVTHICLYDNNNIDGERFEDVIGDYIENGYVELIDYRGRKVCQHQAYMECYHNNKNNYDWVMFFDCDEFLKLNKCRSIGEYLTMPQFVNFDMIHVNWRLVGDNGSIEVNDKPLWERFPEPLPVDIKVGYDFTENAHIKSIVRGGLEDIIFDQKGFSHTPQDHKLRCSNSIGFTCDGNSPFTNVDYQFAELLHYSTKTAKEYAEKMKNGFPDQEWDGSRVQNLIETRFFKTNVVTQEKVDIFKNELGIDMSYLLPKKYEGEKSEDVKIFSLCYDKKNFKFIDDKYVTPLQVGAANGTDVCDLKDNTGDNISGINYFFIENTGTYWIWKNVHGAKYKGQMQYRRPLFGVNENMDIDKIFEQYDVITCSPFYHKEHNKPTPEEPMCIPANTVEEGYGFSNCIDDLYILEMVIKFYFPDYYEDYVKYIKQSDRLYYSNGFIMKSADFDRYAEFLFACLNIYAQMANIKTPNDLVDHVKYNLEVGKYIRYKPNEINDGILRWQCSICGFLSERIWTLWVQHNFRHPRICELPYIKMEPEKMYT